MKAEVRKMQERRGEEENRGSWRRCGGEKEDKRGRKLTTKNYKTVIKQKRRPKKPQKRYNINYKEI